MQIPKLNFLPASLAGAFSHPTWDLMLLFGLFALLFFYGLYAGKRKIGANLVYTYVALLLVSALPIDSALSGIALGQNHWTKITIFCVLFFALVFLLSTGRERGFSGASSWWQVFVLSLVHAGFLFYIIVSFLPSEYSATLAPWMTTVFVGANARVWWLAGPLVIFILLRRLSSWNSY